MDSQWGRVGKGGGGRRGGITYWESKEFAWLVVMAYQGIVIRIYTLFFFRGSLRNDATAITASFLSKPFSFSFSFCLFALVFVSRLVFSFSFWLSLISYARQPAEPSHSLWFGVPQNSSKSNKFMLCHAQKRITDSWLYVVHTTEDILCVCVMFLFPLIYPVSWQSRAYRRT